MNALPEIERFIVDELLLGETQVRLGPDEALVSSGVLDSMALLRLVSFLEERFSVVVEDGELIPTNFETLNKINAYVKMKSQK